MKYQNNRTCVPQFCCDIKYKNLKRIRYTLKLNDHNTGKNNYNTGKNTGKTIFFYLYEKQ